MVEVPSILFEIDQAAEMVDFFSIGTNDLIQYIFAVDRNNEHVASSYDSSHPVLWNIIEQVAQTGKHHNIPVTVCGEMAGNPEYTERFIQAGITGLSMSPIMIPDVKRALIKAVRTSEESQYGEKNGAME
jgi:phosphoenolpyruvate-protein kinase (PTS system EI component)